MDRVTIMDNVMHSTNERSTTSLNYLPPYTYFLIKIGNKKHIIFTSGRF